MTVVVAYNRRPRGSYTITGIQFERYALPLRVAFRMSHSVTHTSGVVVCHENGIQKQFGLNIV